MGHGRHKGRRAQAQCWTSTGAAAHLPGLVGALHPKCQTGQDQPLWLLSQKKLHIPGSLSLSLSSTGRESERRGQGGGWTLIRSNHPTAIFGQCVLYPASVRIITSSQRTVSIEKVFISEFISEFIMAIHDFQNISKSVPGGRPGGTAPIAETGVVPAP